MASPINVVNSRFVDAAGQSIVLRGASRWSLEWGPGDGHFQLADFQAMRAWGLNCVRIPLNSTGWLSGGTGFSAAQYHQAVASAVGYAQSAGLYPILVGQWSDYSGEHNAPMAHPRDLSMWTDVTARFGDAVGYVPVTEPHNVTDQEWFSGWQGGPGMPDLVKAIRANAPNAVIFVNGLHWGNDVSFLDPASPYKIEGPNIAYEVHIYSNWTNGNLDQAIANHAIVAGEFGIQSGGHDLTAQTLAYFEGHSTGYMAWAWGDDQPVILLDTGGWSGVPRAPFGVAYHAFLANLGKTPPPPTPVPVSTPPPVVAPPPIPTPAPTGGPMLGTGFTSPAMGWNHYNRFGDTVNEQLILDCLKAFVASGLPKAGYLYFNLDDSWQGQRDAAGHLQADPTRFPNGLKPIADAVHAAGLRFGIYMSNGTQTCGHRVGNQGHFDQDVADAAAIGVDYLKLDICTDGWQRDVQADATAFAAAIKATGRPIVFSLSSGGAAQPWLWAEQVGVNSYRVGDDICGQWTVTVRNNACYCYRPPKGGVGSIIAGADGNHLLDAQPDVVPGHVGDPDMLEVGNFALTADECRSQMTVWCLASAPLICGHDPRSISAPMLAILSNPEAIAINQDPACHGMSRTYNQGNVLGFVKPLADGGSAVGLVNLNDTAANVSLRWSDLGIALVGVPTRECWSQTDRGAQSGYAGSIPAHGALLFRLDGTSGTPAPIPAPAPGPTPTPTPAPSPTPTPTPAPTPPPTALPALPDGTVTVDTCVDLSHLAVSTGFRVDATNPASVGAPQRIARTTTGEQSAVWEVPGAVYARVDYAQWLGEPPISLTLFASTDGATWTPLNPVATTLVQGDAHAGLWRRLALDTPLPTGTTALRVTWPADATAWNGQVGPVTWVTGSTPLPVPTPTPTPTPAPSVTLQSLLDEATKAGLHAQLVMVGSQQMLLVS